MAHYSLGGVNDQCRARLWVVQETGMLPLLSCDSDTTACLKVGRRVQVCRGKKRKTWWYQSYSGDSKDELGIIHAHNMAFIAIYGTLLIECRETTTYNLRYCRLKLFVYGWLIPILTSWVLKKSTNHSTNLSQQSVYQERNKYEKNNLKAVFLSSRAVCLHLACHVPVASICPFRRRSLQTCCI